MFTAAEATAMLTATIAEAAEHQPQCTRRPFTTWKQKHPLLMVFMLVLL